MGTLTGRTCRQCCSASPDRSRARSPRGAATTVEVLGDLEVVLCVPVAVFVSVLVAPLPCVPSIVFIYY